MVEVEAIWKGKSSLTDSNSGVEAKIMSIRVAIFGGSGYGGSELLRILLFHPNAEIVLVTANEHAGKAVGEVHKNLNGLTELRFDKAPDDLSALRISILLFSRCRMGRH